MKQKIFQKIAGTIRWLHLNYIGLVFGLFFYFLSLTPSLLPTPAILAGLIGGITFVVGYAIGVILSWLYRNLIGKELSKRFKKYAWIVLLSLSPILIVAFGIWTAGWQNEIRQLIEVPNLQGQEIATIVLITVFVAAIILTIVRILFWIVKKISGLFSHWLPSKFSFAASYLILGIFLVWLYSGVLASSFVNISNDIYRENNAKTNEGAIKPETKYRSGGEESLVSWESLGRQGRNFIGTGPSVDQLSEFNDEPALDPIRVYAGIDTADTLEERAKIAVNELERTGAFERKILAVMTATGTGWIEPQTADSLEYIWNGDTAMVTIQYSYLPSWISFLVNQQDAAMASKILFDEVYRKWSALPEDNRPKLYAYGLSLGAYGSQSVFSGVDDLKNRTDGALFAGPPSNSEPWKYFVAHRDSGSPAWMPVFENGETVRFADIPEDVDQPNTKWQEPRVLYLQHASDPVVYWTPDLIFGKPDWLRESRGRDLTPDMQWYPFVTFMQVSIDLFFATTVPSGHGHNYGNIVSYAWADVTNPPNWTPEKEEALQEIISKYPVD